MILYIIGSVRIIGQTIGRLFSGLVPLLWQKKCCNCGVVISETDKFLCNDCWVLLRQCSGGDYCWRCGKDASKYALLPGGCADCLEKDFHFDAIARVGIYTDLLRNMILKFKFSDGTELRPFLSFLAESAFAGSTFAKGVDFFVPVPLHWTRRLGRGYNQSHLIAKSFEGNSPRLNCDLVRIRNTKRQAALTDAARLKNVKGAFAVRKGHSFKNKVICLVDDIKTTGATLNECAWVLKKAGANRVYATVLSVAHQDSAK